NRAEAVRALLPLAQNYLKSDVYRRVIAAQPSADSKFNIPNQESAIRKAGSPAGQLGSGASPQSSPGLWSELRFRLRRPLGILTGTIDKLLITPAANGQGVDVEIIDFKTNRFAAVSKNADRTRAKAAASRSTVVGTRQIAKVESRTEQGSF